MWSSIISQTGGCSPFPFAIYNPFSRCLHKPRIHPGRVGGGRNGCLVHSLPWVQLSAGGLLAPAPLTEAQYGE